MSIWYEREGEGEEGEKAWKTQMDKDGNVLKAKEGLRWGPECFRRERGVERKRNRKITNLWK